jgi:hypothetical protein
MPTCLLIPPPPLPSSRHPPPAVLCRDTRANQREQKRSEAKTAVTIYLEALLKQRAADAGSVKILVDAL